VLNQSSPSVVQAPIAAGQSLSAPINLGAQALHGIVVPAGWTAAGLSFQVSPDGVNFYELYNIGGTEVTATAAANTYIALDPTLWRTINCLKIRSGTAAAPVAQVSAAALQLVVGTIV
jgi:hypothetical protein